MLDNIVASQNQLAMRRVAYVLYKHKSLHMPLLELVEGPHLKCQGENSLIQYDLRPPLKGGSKESLKLW